MPARCSDCDKIFYWSQVIKIEGLILCAKCLFKKLKNGTLTLTSGELKVFIQEGEGLRRSSKEKLTEKGIFLILYKDNRHQKGILITKRGVNEIAITVPAFNPMKQTKTLDLRLEIVEGVK